MGWVPSLTLRCSSFAHPAQRHHRDLSDFPLRCALELLLPLPAPAEPAAQAAVASLAAAVDRVTSAGYHIIRGPLGALLQPAFLDAHVRAGGVEFCLLSLGAAASALPHADSISITPSGQLRMAVSRDTFQRLGLPGKASVAAPGEQYFICVDLCAASFVPGKKLHDKVVERVGNLIPASLDYLCLFTRDGVPQSIEFPQPITACHVPFSAIHRALSPACLPNVLIMSEIAAPSSGLRGGERNEGPEEAKRRGGGAVGGGGEGEAMECSAATPISSDRTFSKKTGEGESGAGAGGVEQGVGEGRAGGGGIAAVALEMHEWIGAASCGITRHMNECARRMGSMLGHTACSLDLASHVTSATPPVTSAAAGSVHSLRVCGPINNSQSGSECHV
ncbi:hypothetical protein CLOM_g15107 [Closterium sp. NIES-68]|nr:hypothetical protein CLOM_g15107 [Closterium sp. NIES-68]GJP58129.1 hypothetical protein CLOP_g20675 [Closterium sp. NIES-67]